MVFFNWSKKSAMLFTSNSLQFSRYPMWSKVVTQALVPLFWVTQKTGHPAAGRARQSLLLSFRLCLIISNLWGYHSLDIWTSKSLSASIRLLIKRWSYPSLLSQAHSHKAWVLNCFQTTCCACSIKILLDSCNVFPKCGKIDQALQRLCQQNEDKPI